MLMATCTIVFANKSVFQYALSSFRFFRQLINVYVFFLTRLMNILEPFIILKLLFLYDKRNVIKLTRYLR